MSLWKVLGRSEWGKCTRAAPEEEQRPGEKVQLVRRSWGRGEDSAAGAALGSERGEEEQRTRVQRPVRHGRWRAVCVVLSANTRVFPDL